MTQTPAPADPFVQHPRLSEVVEELGFERYPLFLSGLVYQEPGGPLRLAIVVVTRQGDLVAVERGEVFKYAGRIPTSRLFDDEDFTEQPPGARREALADLNEAFFARDVAAWTGGRRGINEIGIRVLRRWFAPEKLPDTITRSEVLGIVPLEASNTLLDTLRELADQHDRGFMVEEIMQQLV
jgi:hypothetical protein